MNTDPPNLADVPEDAVVPLHRVSVKTKRLQEHLSGLHVLFNEGCPQEVLDDWKIKSRVKLEEMIEAIQELAPHIRRAMEAEQGDQN
tara:strand:- start:8264 stop:8524 length:261 start_codon:yes stop_codon:yes gene_type:complete